MGKPREIIPSMVGKVGLLQGPIWPIWRADLQVKFQVAGIPTHWKAWPPAVQLATKDQMGLSAIRAAAHLIVYHHFLIFSLLYSF